MDVLAIVTHPLGRGAIQGLAAAAVVDVLAFRKWQNWSDAATYDWGVASWRWFQGALTGLLVSAGFQGLT